MVRQTASASETHVHAYLPRDMMGIRERGDGAAVTRSDARGRDEVGRHQADNSKRNNSSLGNLSMVAHRRVDAKPSRSRDVEASRAHVDSKPTCLSPPEMAAEMPAVFTVTVTSAELETGREATVVAVARKMYVIPT